MHNTTNHLILSSTSIEGTNVRNLADEKLGEIKDIMLDVDSGRIVYAVLSVSEGFLGLDNKLFAIPWKALRFDTDREIALLDVSKDRLKDSPGFDKDNWPSTPQREFVDEVHSFYGYEPFYNRGDREMSDIGENSRTEQSSFNRDTNNPDRGINTGSTTASGATLGGTSGAGGINTGSTSGFERDSNEGSRDYGQRGTSEDRNLRDPDFPRDRGDAERNV